MDLLMGWGGSHDNEAPPLPKSLDLAADMTCAYTRPTHQEAGEVNRRPGHCDACWRLSLYFSRPAGGCISRGPYGQSRPVLEQVNFAGRPAAPLLDALLGGLTANPDLSSSRSILRGGYVLLT